MKKLETLLKDRIKELESEEKDRVQREAIEQFKRQKAKEDWEAKEQSNRQQGRLITFIVIMSVGIAISVILMFISCSSGWTSKGIDCQMRYLCGMPIGIVIGYLTGYLIFPKETFDDSKDKY